MINDFMANKNHTDKYSTINIKNTYIKNNGAFDIDAVN